jgi:hypothetical protein
MAPEIALDATVEVLDPDAAPPPLDAALPADAAFASPIGSGTACTREAPCDWQTATRSTVFATTVLLDGTYAVGPGRVWCVREGRTVVADHRFGATIVFEGNSDATGDDEGSCSNGSGFGFGVHGTLDGVEIIAPARWSAIDVHPPPGVRAVLRNLWVHDVNTAPQVYGGYGNCVQQGAIDLDHGELRDSVVYRVGQRTGVDGTRGPTLESCINYHLVYIGPEAQVTNNLLADGFGGWCVHGYTLDDVHDEVRQNTLSGCHQGAVIFPFVSDNVVSLNVMVNGRTDTVPGWPSPASSPYGTCIIAYESADLGTSSFAIGNVCRNNPNDALYVRASESFDRSSFDGTADVAPALVPTAALVAGLDGATTSEARLAFLGTVSVDRVASHGAGFAVTR